MPNTTLTPIICFDQAIQEFRLTDLKPQQAIKAILNCSLFDKLPIYFNINIEAVSIENYFGNQYDENHDFVDFIPPVYASSQELAGEKQILNTDFRQINENVVITRFLKNGSTYLIPNETEEYTGEQVIKYSDLYIKREHLVKYNNYFSQVKILERATKQATLEADGSSKNLLKALALLAREKAENGEGYKKGQKVNAKAFKDRIIYLARKYDISTNGLKSIADKINPVLIELDIKEIK